MLLRYLPSFSLCAIILLTACDNHSKSADTYNPPKTRTWAYKDGLDSTDAIREEWLVNKQFDNRVFQNTISLKDGQSATAGMSFVMQMDTTFFVVSARHLLGPDGGFEKTLAPVAYDSLKEWKLAGTTDIVLKKISAVDTKSDVLLIDIDKASLAQVSPIRLSRAEIRGIIYMSMPDGGDRITRPAGIRLGISQPPMPLPDTCYLLGAGKDDLHELILLDHKKGAIAFRRVKDFSLPGYSGAPILDYTGRVIAIVTGETEEGLVVGTRIVLPEDF